MTQSYDASELNSDTLLEEIKAIMATLPDPEPQPHPDSTPQQKTPSSQTPHIQQQHPPMEPSEQEFDLLDTVADVGKGVAAGAYNAVAETVNLGSDAINLFRDDNDQIAPFMSNASFGAETSAGKIAQSISQFAAGFIGAGKFLKAAKLLQGAGKAVTVGRGMAQGALADFTVFDAHEERLSNLIESNPALANPITNYLAADKGDSAAEGRFKNVLEGMALGVVGEALFAMVRGVKAMRAAKTVAEAEDAAIRTADEVKAIAVNSTKRPNPSNHVEAVVHGDAAIIDDALNAAGGKVEVDVHGLDPHALKDVKEGLDVMADSGLTHPSAPAETQTAKVGMGEEDIRKIIRQAVDATLSEKRTVDDLLNGEFLIGNMKRVTFNTPEEREFAGRYMLEVLDKTLKGKGVQTHEAILRNSQEWVESLSLQDMVEVASHDRETMQNLASRALAYKMGAKSAGDTLLNLHYQMEIKGKTPELVAEFEKASKLYQDLSLATKDITTASARMTASGKISPKYLDADVLSNIIRAVDGDTERVLKVLNMTRAKRVFDTLTEVVINGLLSSPKTYLTDISGNFFKMLILPTNKILGGAFMGNKQIVREGVETYTGLIKYAGESWKAMKMAAKMGENILDSGHKVMDSRHRQIMGSYEKIRDEMLLRKLSAGGQDAHTLTDMEEIKARAMSFIGLPSRVLLATDELFKQLNYRANMYGKLAAEAAIKFGSDTAGITEFIDRGMREAFEQGGRGINKGSLRYAQEATWTQSLRNDAYFGGGIGQAVSNAANQYPPLRLIVPFIRTPTNLIRDFIAHTPVVNMVTKRYRDAIAEGGERAAMAYGATATGSLLWASAISLAVSGKMTGGYPRDSATRQAWIDAGIEPYSFKIGDTYISFARLDPFSTFFGIAADYAEYTRNWNDSAKGNWVSGAVLALSNNILSKSYLTGVTDLINALGDQSVDSKAMQQYIQRSVTMFIPYSSGLRFTRQLTDDPLREVRSSFDAVLNTIPGASRLLPERYSWITGKAISHNLFWGEHKDDIVTQELARLGDNLSIGAPGRKLKGVELDGAQYSRLCQLQGTVTLGGLTQHSRLVKLMKSASYDLGRRKMPDMPGDIENPRTRMVEKIVKQYRKAAQQALLKEDASLAEAVAMEHKIRMSARRGDAQTVKDLLASPAR